MGIIVPEIFAVWKPKGPSSNGVLNRIRHFLGTRHVGHAGTLDPLAEGILVVGIGKGTKRLAMEVAKEKEYETVIKLGARSQTDDCEGEEIITEGVIEPSMDEIKKVVVSFIGIIDQVPPIWSAIKVKGKESYKLAREGKEAPLKSRKVEVKSAEILDYSWPYLNIRFTTGSGVYIRSLARDIGDRLGTGGYMAELVRTRVGDFRAEDCLDIADISSPAVKVL
ncbi:MAG: tRNA pseudouridine(55) synthase TruB [Candidatus Colwellbacteria bacterium]|nr:tRNA pseudouridine(55) synthase TruB [Candidatus Colwellbacteria bacterium]